MDVLCPSDIDLLLTWPDDPPTVTCTCCSDDINPAHLHTRCRPCGHVFHTDCIEQWKTTLRNKGKPLTCPTCRGTSTLEASGVDTYAQLKEEVDNLHATLDETGSNQADDLQKICAAFSDLMAAKMGKKRCDIELTKCTHYMRKLAQVKRRARMLSGRDAKRVYGEVASEYATLTTTKKGIVVRLREWRERCDVADEKYRVLADEFI
jgi:hypothetical protein